jgi:hypothetical protein
MAGVDLNTYRFDYDLTFAGLLMNADGTIYHTYAGRDWTDPQSHLSTKSLERALEAGLDAHAARAGAGRRGRRAKKLTIEQLPAMKRRLEAGKVPKCFHCHTVNDMRHEERVARKQWKRDDIWTWPDPIQVGLRLEQDEQHKVAHVEPGSPAAKAGLRVGDSVRTLGTRSVVTFGDVQRVLEDTPPRPTTLPVEWTRGGERKQGVLKLGHDWKAATPRVFAWRASKWPLSPKPGFGGPRLSQIAMVNAGLPEDGFAFRIGYVVTWGPNAHTGRNARKAGLRKGDVIFSVAGKSDFDSVAHFHAWFRLTQKAGTTVPVERLRNGKREIIQLPVVD